MTNIDVGCGCLDVHKRTEGIGIDVNRGLADVICDARHMPFNCGSFDSATCHHVLEHVEDPEEILKEMHRVVKGGGKVDIVYPVNAMEQESMKVLLHPLTFFNIICGFWKVVRRRRIRGMAHKTDITVDMISRFLCPCTMLVKKHPRTLDNIEWFIKRKIEYDGWEEIVLCCLNLCTS